MISPKRYQQIAADVARGIADGQYVPGARLPGERDLAERLDVSRTTVREAMIALEIQGLVEARQGSGIYVRHAPPPVVDRELDVGAFELIEARRLFEGEAAALAATRIGPDAIGGLMTALALMERHDPATPEAMAADRAFHLRIAEATGNSVVRSAIETLWRVRERSPLCIHMFAQAHRQGVHPRADEHRRIAQSIAATDPAAARTAMHDHLDRVREDLLAATELGRVAPAPPAQ